MTADGSPRRLHWGCGGNTRAGWIDSDIRELPGIDLPADILAGLPLEDASVDYAVSHHALQEIPLSDQVTALAELRRVLRPGGVLRLGLPDLEKGFEAYRRGDRDYFLVPDEDARDLGLKLVTHVLWYGYSRVVYVPGSIEELLRRAGFADVHHVAFGETTIADREILVHDDRAGESLFVEAVR